MNENYIQALRAEREGYVRRNLPDRVRQVDDALRALGADIRDDSATGKETATVEVESERAVSPRGTKRKVR